MKWVDIQDISISLVDNYPDVDPLTLRFTQLRDLVLSLPDFSDKAEGCNEKILEAIQMCWMDEIA